MPLHQHRLFIDSADATALKRWLPCGVLHGVTTNPTLLHRAGVDCTPRAIRDLACLAFDLGATEFQAQAWGGSAEQYQSIGQQLADISPQMVIKLPMNEAGLTAAHRLLDQEIRVTMTAVYGVEQAVAAASIGVDYVAPYHGRLRDDGRDADAIVQDMLKIMQGIPAERRTRVLVASIRSARIAGELAAAGCDTLTVAPLVLEDMLERPDSAAAITRFEQDASGT